MFPGRLPLDSSLTKFQQSVAWAKVNANWIRGKWGLGGWLGLKEEKKDNISGEVSSTNPSVLLLKIPPPHPFFPRKYISSLHESAGTFLRIQSDITGE